VRKGADPVVPVPFYLSNAEKSNGGWEQQLPGNSNLTAEPYKEPDVHSPCHCLPTILVGSKFKNSVECETNHRQYAFILLSVLSFLERKERSVGAAPAAQLRPLSRCARGAGGAQSLSPLTHFTMLSMSRKKTEQGPWMIKKQGDSSVSSAIHQMRLVAEAHKAAARDSR
jgi:hypothetical protein